MKKIDACGLSCPEPVIILKRELKENSEIILLIDNKTSVETCTRFAISRGYNVTAKIDTKPYELIITKGEKS